MPCEERNGDVYQNGASSLQKELVLHIWHYPRSSQLRDRTQVPSPPTLTPTPTFSYTFGTS